LREKISFEAEPVSSSGVGKTLRTNSAVAHHLAGFPYSLYVLHFPFCFACETCWSLWGAPATAAHLLSAAIVGAGCLLFAWCVSLFTEKKTDVTHRRIKRFLA